MVPKPKGWTRKKNPPNQELLTEVGVTVYYLQSGIRESFHCLIQDNIDRTSSWSGARKYEQNRKQFLHGPNFPRRKVVYSPTNKRHSIPEDSAYLPESQVAAWVDYIINDAKTRVSFLSNFTALCIDLTIL
jgi:hypothetical protein